MTTVVKNWIFVTAVCTVVMLLASCFFIDNLKSLVVLEPGGKAEYWRGGWFGRKGFSLERHGREWQVFDAASLDGGNLLLPFECRYNESRRLRLNLDGRVYIIDPSGGTQEELRVVKGEWSYDASDHWQSLFDGQGGRP